MMHSFTRVSSTAQCFFCKDAWPGTDSITSKYQSCDSCGILVHSSCRALAQQCLPCSRHRKQSSARSALLHEENVAGSIRVQLLHAYDICVAAESTLYGIMKLVHKQQVHRTANAESGFNDCVWPAASGIASQRLPGDIKQQARNICVFDIFHPPHLPIEFQQDFTLEVEIWSSYLGLFDSQIASAVVNVWPVLLYPRMKLERWFVLVNSSSSHDEHIQSTGKVLLGIEFVPSEEYANRINVADRPSTDRNDGVQRNLSSAVDTPIDPPLRSHIERLPVSDNDMNESTDEIHSMNQENAPKFKDAINHRTGTISRDASVGQGLNCLCRSRNPDHSTVTNEADESSDSESKDLMKERVISTDSRDKNKVQNHLNRSLSRGGSADDIDSSERSSIGLRQRKNKERNAIPATKSKESAVKADIASSDRDGESDISSLASAYCTAVDVTNSSTSVIAHWLYGIDEKQIAHRKMKLSSDESDDNFEFKARTGINQSGMGTISRKDVGFIHIHLISAFKFDVKDAAEGDHYVMLVVDGDIGDSNGGTSTELKTKSVFGSATPIFNIHWNASMPHYRSGINMYLMDANSHRRVGRARVTCFDLMQRDIDQQRRDWRKASIERITMRDPGDTTDIGYFTARLAFEEDLNGLFLCDNILREAPNSPDEVLSMQRLGVHIARFSAIISLFGKCYAEYEELMAWKDPLLTFTCFIVFMFFILRVSSDYALSGITFIAVVLMTRMLMRRHAGRYVHHYIEKAGDQVPKLEYRPIALLRVSVMGFRNISPASSVMSSDGGRERPTKPSVKVTYRPMSEAADGKVAAGAQVEHIVGFFGSKSHTLGFSIPESSSTVSKLVSDLVGRSEPRGKDDMLHNTCDPWPLSREDEEVIRTLGSGANEAADIGLLYPVLQPVAAQVKGSGAEVGEVAGGKGDDGSSSEAAVVSTTASALSSQQKVQQRFLPWEQHEGVLRVTLMHEEHSSFIDVEEEYISISIKDLIKESFIQSTKHNRASVFECKQWFESSRTNNNLNKVDSFVDFDQFAYDSTSSIFMATPSSGADDANSSGFYSKTRNTEVLLRLQLELPDAQENVKPSVQEQERSRVLQQILSQKTGDNSSTISVLWNMRDNVTYVQNIMSWLLDVIESCKNIFNWTSPMKTYPIYLTVIAAWLATILIPGRIIICGWGLYQFFFVFLPIPDGEQTTIRFKNLIKSIPNDDDLDAHYSKDRKAFVDRRLGEWDALQKQHKPHLVLPTQWQGLVKIHATTMGRSSTTRSVTSAHWAEVFILLQGRRLVWWQHEADFDMGREAYGQLLLCGHCGITEVSPVVMRQLGAEVCGRMIDIFGQDAHGWQQRLSISFSTSEQKEGLVTKLQQLLT